jgi:biopolymer transport protein ExbD
MRMPPRNPRAPLNLKMTPMIDVVFLLLVFFLWTSSFERPEFDLPTALAAPAAPLAETATERPPPEPIDELVIVISGGTGEGPVQLRLGEQSVADFEALAEQLRQIARLGVQPPVIVDPDPETAVHWAIRAFDIARSIGFDRVLFAAES